MPSAKDFNPASQGLMVSLIGPPGAGKSRFTASAATLGKGFVFLAPSGELASYAGLDVDYELIEDPQWDPLKGDFVAEGFVKMRKVLADLRKRDDLKFVGLDTGSSIAEIIGHSILATSRTDNPQDLGNPFSYYKALRNRMIDLVRELDVLRTTKKVHVIVNWHEDVRELEGLGVQRRELNKGKTEVHWDQTKVAMVEGSFRNDLGKWFDLHCYAEPVVGSKPFRCKLSVLPSSEARLAKTRLGKIVPKLQEMTEIPNDFPKLLKLVEEAYK